MRPKWPKLNLVPELCLSSGCHGLSVWGNWLLEILHEVGKDLLVHPSSSPTLSCRPIEAAARKPHAPIPWLSLCHCCIVRSVAQSCTSFVTPRTVSHQAPLSLGFSRQGC